VQAIAETLLRRRTRVANPLRLTEPAAAASAPMRVRLVRQNSALPKLLSLKLTPSAVLKHPGELAAEQCRRLLEAHLPEMHGAFWLCLFAALQGQGPFSRHPGPDLQRTEVSGPGAALAQDNLGSVRALPFWQWV